MASFRDPVAPKKAMKLPVPPVPGPVLPTPKALPLAAGVWVQPEKVPVSKPGLLTTLAEAKWVATSKTSGIAQRRMRRGGIMGGDLCEAVRELASEKGLTNRGKA